MLSLSSDIVSGRRHCFNLDDQLGKEAVLEKYQEKACLGKGNRNAQKTPGGLIFRQIWNNMQFFTSGLHPGGQPKSYMVGYGNNYPRQVHRRASSKVQEIKNSGI